jgi:hypothetical protein
VVANKLRYSVLAAPERVVESIAASAQPGSMVGFSMADSGARRFVGSISKNRSFTLRRPRGLLTAPRVAVLRGQVEPSGTTAAVVATFELNPAVRLARIVWVIVFVAMSLLVLPAATRQPGLLWVPVVMGVVVFLMIIPFEFLARADREQLRCDLEDVLRRTGSVSVG